MTKVIFILCFLAYGLGFSQVLETDSVEVTKPITPPQIVIKAPYGKMINLGEISLKFKEVVSDSRCPSDVNCIWAGEAVVRVELYKDGKFLEEREIKFPSENTKNLFTSDALNLEGYSLNPYPKAEGGKIDKNAYCLNLTINKKTD
ncbi:MAG: hypothetical protein V7767_02495 [Leeuwenhoekiella sp.]